MKPTKLNLLILPASLLMAAMSLVGTANAAVISMIAADDTYTLQTSGFANTNFSTDTTISFGAAAGSQARSMLMRFDVSSVATIPQADIVSVQLRLTLAATTGNRRATIGALNDGNSNWTNTGATWNTKDGTNAWVGSAGARTIATDTFGSLATVTVLNADTAGTVYTITLSPASFGDSVNTWEELFDNWADGTSNGLVLYNDGTFTPAGGVQSFHSRESSTEAFRPTLIVTSIPEPSASLLGGLGLLALLRRRR